MATRVRHSARLLNELVRYAFGNRLWWLLLFIPLAAIGAMLVSTAEAVVPYTVYTLF